MGNYNHFAGTNVRRIEALSDGVFAIAFTLLILEIKVPPLDYIDAETGKHIHITTESGLLESLKPLLPKFLIYFLTFMTMGIFWTGQGVQLNYIGKYDRNLNWSSIFFLAVISLFPFTTAFLGEHIEFKLAIGLYWLNILLAGVFIYLHWSYACKHNYLTVEGEERKAIDRAIRRRVIIAQSLYLFGALLCFISPYLSIGFIIVIQLNYAFAFFEAKRQRGKAKK